MMVSISSALLIGSAIPGELRDRFVAAQEHDFLAGLDPGQKFSQVCVFNFDGDGHGCAPATIAG